MFAPTSLAARVSTLVLSVSAHGAVALVALGGHGAGETILTAPCGDRTIEIAAVEPLTAVPDRPRSSPGTMHTHPYPVPVNHDVIPHDPSLRHPPVAMAASDRVAMATSDPPMAAPVVVEAPAIEAPRFTLTVGHESSAPGGVTGIGRGAQPGAGSDEPMTEEATDRPATLVSGNPPAYTREAEAAGVEADVPLEIVLDTQGAVVRARVLETVGYGLDEVALLGIRAYRFAPALRGGRPVPVRMRWLMRFQLR